MVLVLRYPPGAGIGWHRDRPAFGPEVVGHLPAGDVGDAAAAGGRDARRRPRALRGAMPRLGTTGARPRRLRPHHPPRAEASRPPSQRAAVFEGAVTGPDGKPVTDAAVVISSPADMFEPPIVVRTDAEGRFRATARSRRGPHTVRVEAAGFAARTHREGPPRRAAARRPRQGRDDRGRRSKDAASGEPVAGARVEAREDARLERDLGRLDRRGHDGDATKGSLPPRRLAPGPHTVAASARGAGRASRSGVTPGQRVELLLVAGPSIAGRVLLPDGEAGGAGGGARRAGGRLLQARVAAADAAGRYELAGLSRECTA